MTARDGAGCVFCAIRDGAEPASVVYEDDVLLAFMDIRPVRRGQLLVVPKRHIDHFDDLPDDLAGAAFVVGLRVSRVLRRVLQPRRVGLIVHGFGVPHAHLVVVPLEHPWDITAAQFASIEDGRIVFRWESVPLADREDLEAVAHALRAAIGSGVPAAALAHDQDHP